jgi:hypothetical protein
LNRLTVTKVASNKYWVPPYPINLDATALKDAYDEACISHTSERARLERLLQNLARVKVRNFLRRKSAAIYLLARRRDFFNFWADQREFCKKIVNGVMPYGRAVTAFFQHKGFGNETRALVKKLVREDEQVMVAGKKRPRFIVELAKWSVSTKTARCPCLDIGVAISTGRLPDGKKNKKLRAKYRHSWRNYQMAKQQLCLDVYPGVCFLTAKGRELFAGGEMMTMKASLKAGAGKLAGVGGNDRK